MKYKVLRPSLWFCTNDIVELQDLKKYFNDEAIKQLLDDGFIKVIQEKQLPKSWEELDSVKGYWIDEFSNIQDCFCLPSDNNRNIFSKKEEALAAIALAQLSQLKKAYNGDWTPDYTDNEFKFSIFIDSERFQLGVSKSTRTFLTFKTAELRDEFSRNFKELILTAKPLL